MQLTIQAISNLHRYGCKPIVFLIENGGYRAERLIHGKPAPYNAVPILDYAKLGDVFGPEYKSLYFWAN
jgi:TPP-dependent 2-oxoacid decarboxylase